jgi:predicted HD phosphohydrolase
MKEGDKADYDLLNAHETEYASHTATRLLDAMESLDASLSGYQITRLGHSLQSATRAWRDGADTDWLVSALLHDIGDIYAPYNHDEYAAAILRPFVREQCAWVVENTVIFRCFITRPMSGPIRTSVMLTRATPIMTIVPPFANGGIKPVSTRIMTPCRCRFLHRCYMRFLPARPMILT